MTLAERLNSEVWCKIAPSLLHGVGVFAIRGIPKGQKIYAQTNTFTWLEDGLEGILPEIKELILQRWPLAEKYPFLSPNTDVRLLSFMNHSSSANYDPLTDCVTRDIKIGEEIVEDYGEYKPVDNS